MKNIKRIIPLASMAIFYVACTDLEVQELDSKVIESSSGSFTGVDPTEALASAYLDLRNYASQDNIYALLEVTADQQFVPTRGTDWGDNGVWRVLHTHEWDANHQYVLSSWNMINSYLYKLGQLLDEASEPSALQTAEGKFLRAFNMFYLLDLYGQVPIRGVNDGPDVDPEVLSAAEVIDQIVADLEAAIPELPDLSPDDDNIQASKAAARFLLAKTLLNKQVFLGEAETSADDMTEVITLVDAIAASGYALEDDYFNIFAHHDDNTETIFYTDQQVSFHIFNGLHYYQGVPGNLQGGWNGFTVTQATYDLFEGPESNAPNGGQDKRRGYVPDTLGIGFLIGQQYSPTEAGEALQTRSGKPLIFTRDLPGLLGNGEAEGIRALKYHPTWPKLDDNGDIGGPYKRGYVLFRYADAHLMKVEAILRGGSGGGDATTLLNELRTLRGASSATATLDELIDERGRELYKEGWRRNDQIRFGTFTQQWEFKTNTESFRVKFPIPSVALSSNPNLVQNDGY